MDPPEEIRIPEKEDVGMTKICKGQKEQTQAEDTAGTEGQQGITRMGKNNSYMRHEL